MKRVIDKKTNVFKRNDYEFNPEDEMGVVNEIPYGMYCVPEICPIWDGEKWVQNVEPPEPEPQPQEPSFEERLQALEAIELERILGGGF